MIEGVVIVTLKQIVDERGKVMHMLRSDSSLFMGFGEIYFSVVNPSKIKAWKKHYSLTQHITVPIGKIKLVIYDERKGSKSWGEIQVTELGEENYSLIRIPPLVWYGFQGISNVPALIVNCTDLPHDPNESEQVSSNSNRIPYKW